MSELPPPTPRPDPYGVPAYPAGAPTNSLAIVSLVLSIAGLFTFVTAIAGVICGHVALAQVKRTGEQGQGLALGGVIAGYVVIGLYVLGLIAAVLLVIWGLQVVTTVVESGTPV